MTASDIKELQACIHENIVRLEQKEKELMTVTKKEWKRTRYAALGFLVVLVPTIIFSLYTLVLAQPKQEAFINSQEHFLKGQYSDVITSLQDYKVEDMPRVVLYELSRSYIILENFQKKPRENNLNLITLHTDPQFYYYWINIGRGNAGEALDIARSLGWRDGIVYGLTKQFKEVISDADLKGEEKQQKLKEIQTELDGYKKEMDAEKKEANLLKEEQAKQAEAAARAEKIKKEEAPQKSSQKQEKESQQPSESNSK